jgi:hypothetical protein
MVRPAPFDFLRALRIRLFFVCFMFKTAIVQKHTFAAESCSYRLFEIWYLNFDIVWDLGFGFLSLTCILHQCIVHPDPSYIGISGCTTIRSILPSRIS